MPATESGCCLPPANKSSCMHTHMSTYANTRTSCNFECKNVPEIAQATDVSAEEAAASDPNDTTDGEYTDKKTAERT